MSIGFIGLGSMGSGMALNLVRSGQDVIVFDTNPDAVQRLRDAGAEGAPHVAELVRKAEVVFTSLPGPKQLEEVVFGPDGIAANLRTGLVLFDLSTSDLALARRIAAHFETAGAAMLDAPVSGGPAGAASGQLTLWVGGDRAAFDRHLALLNIIGDKPRHVGAIGAGTIAKLAHNMVGYTIMLSLAEVFSLAVKAGMDPLDLWKAMRLGLVGRGSPLDMLTKQFLPGTFEPPAFALQLAHKDVTLAMNMARDLGVPMRLAGLTADDMAEALGHGWGGLDSRAFLKLQLERSGVEIAVDPVLLDQAVADAAAGLL